MRAREKSKATGVSGRYVVKSRDAECVQSWGQFNTLPAAQSRLLDVVAAAASGVTIVSAYWAPDQRSFSLTCDVDGARAEFRAWISSRSQPR
jgi:hypothetical protein